MRAMALKYGLSVILTGAAVVCNAQQQPMFTQYMFNALVLNPAYAGSQETFAASAVVRNQWIALEGAPRTQTFSAHTPLDILREHRRTKSPVSVGLTFFNDQIAITRQTGLVVSYAYRINVGRTAWLSFGLQGGFNCFRVEYSKLELDDPSFSIGDVVQWQPDFGAGIYFQTARFYAGLSSPQMLRPNMDEHGTRPGVAPHYFLTSGWVFDLAEKIKIKPGFLLKRSPENIHQIDINCNVYFHEVVNVGVSWRSAESLAVMTQVQIHPRVGVGYAYDFGLGSPLSRLSSGSHEFMLSYQAPRKKFRTINPRLF